MKKPKQSQRVTLVPIDKINFLNPRERNKKIFHEISDNIQRVGLKKPVTLSLRKEPLDGKIYDLACGQGRIEAYIAHGETSVPAIIVEASEDEVLLMSLVENLARRHNKSLDLLQNLETLRQRGYDADTIATKTGLRLEYVRDILHLMTNGEERLTTAVENGQLPLTVAMTIAASSDDNVQKALQDAYDQNLLRGKRLVLAKKIVERRLQRGKKLKSGPGAHSTREPMSADFIMKTYKQEVIRKRAMIRRSNQIENHLVFITAAFRKLLEEDHFVTLLRAEKLLSMPQSLAERIQDSRLGGMSV
jgi:ParB family chromosome partitioning protein